MKIGISLTNKCTKQCWFCYSSSEPNSSVELDFVELSNFITELNSLPNRPLLCFGGGEPFEYSKISDLIDLLENLGYPYSITSNLLNAIPTSRKIARGWLWGSIHMPGDLDRVIATLKLSGNKHIGANVMVMRRYKDKLIDITDRLESEQIPYILTFFKPYGRAQEHYQEELTKEEKIQIITFLCERYKKPVMTDSCQGLAGETRCSCGVSWVTITADKVLKPNSFYPTGVPLERLSLGCFKMALEKIPKRIHEKEVER